MESPLAGLRVLDLSRVVSGPYATRMMADLGAEVVKVETGADGDQSRYTGALIDGDSGMYTQFNVGKSNISIDLTVPGAADLVLNLVERADVVVENFRPGVLTKLGIGAEAMLARNPAVVLLSVSGFGHSGPWTSRRAYASSAHAEAGLMARQAELDNTEPRDLALAAADYFAALHGLVAVLSAIHLRQRTGAGQHIDMSMFDATLATDDYAHFYLDDSADTITRVGGEIWNAKGGPVVLGSVLRNTFGRLRRTFGLTDGLPADASRSAKDQARTRAVQEWMLSFESRDQLHAALDEARLVWADIRPPADALSGELAQAREMVVDITTADGSRRRVVNSPYRFSSARSGLRPKISPRGGDNERVLNDWIGMSAEEVNQLYDAGVIGRNGVPNEAPSPAR